MTANHYSGVFVKWAEPLLALVAHAPLQARTSALEIATATWNAVTLEDAGVAPGSVNQLKQRLAGMPEPGKTLFGGIVLELIKRRRGDFSAEGWAISKCELRSKAGNTYVFIEARALKTPR